MMRRRAAVLLSVLWLFSGVLAAQTVVRVAGTPSSTEAASSISTRVDALLARMSLSQKIGQMTMISVSRLWGDCNGAPGPLNTGCMQRVLRDQQVGAVLSGGGEAPQPNTPAAWARLTNDIQRYAMQHSSLHIPVLYGTDAVHGDNNLLGATIYPHNLGMAATWDPALERDIAAATARTVRATGVNWTFAPVSDLARDIRWGRYYETFGEDPLLASQMVSSAVTGFQSVPGIAATAKHFVGYSGALRGHDRTAADISLRTLQQAYLPPFAAAVQAGVDTVMVDSGSVNGVPVHASHYLLTTILRGQLHFNGVVVTDWQDIESLYDRYHLASSYEDAVRLAVSAGIDMSMVPYDSATFTRDLTDLVKRNAIPMARVNASVRRILTLKFKLGLFGNPFVNVAAAQRAARSGRTLARTAADESMTLVANDGVLPIRKSVRSILVVGPAATSVADQMGGWTVGWQGIPAGVTVPADDVLTGIRRAAPSRSTVRYISGANPSRALSAARRADLVVLVVGESPYAEGLGDTETAALPPAQETLLRALEASHVKVVLVVLGGRPLIMPGVPERVAALLMAWLPGTEGGDAVADALFGRIDPSGRLPVSWPRRIGQEPLNYQQLPGTNSGPDSSYDPLFPFGAGLSYTSFQVDTLSASTRVSRRGSMAVRVVVRNTGKRTGVDVVQVYIHPDDAPVIVPPRRLIAFARVSLNAGASRTLTLRVPVTRLALVVGDVNASGPPVVVPGAYTLMAGGKQTRVVVR